MVRTMGSRADGEDATLYVVTRWYRAPEVLLGYTHYGNAIDLWSMGTILGELLYRKPLLNGENFVNQLEKVRAPHDSPSMPKRRVIPPLHPKINEFVGTPTEEDLWFVTNEKARNFMVRCENMAAHPRIKRMFQLLLALFFSIDERSSEAARL
jgi:serine/threonine protein kinase